MKCLYLAFPLGIGTLGSEIILKVPGCFFKILHNYRDDQLTVEVRNSLESSSDWPLLYSVLVMLCSHTKGDCGLLHTLNAEIQQSQVLERKRWSVSASIKPDSKCFAKAAVQVLQSVKIIKIPTIILRFQVWDCKTEATTLIAFREKDKDICWKYILNR